MSHAVVFVTASSGDEATRIGRALVDERLAACANVVPAIASTYWWQGKVEEAGEALLILKTRQDLVARLTERVKTLHSYTVPEVIAVDAGHVAPAYAAWLTAACKRESSQ